MSNPSKRFSTDAPDKNVKAGLVSIVYDYLEIVVFSICAVLVLFTLIGRLCRVDGNSMRNTLYDRELLVTTSLGTPEQGDIVVFSYFDSGKNEYRPLVKRVIASGGDTVRIDYNTSPVSVYVNDQKLDESYIALLKKVGFHEYTDCGYWLPGQRPMHHYDWKTDIFEATVPDGCYFVMGDNRNDSMDSRTSEVGFVDERLILGRVFLRVKPFTTFG